MVALLIPAALAAAAQGAAPWSDVQRLGTGGEAFLSTDGKGAVYATCHLPCKLFVSHDHGKTFQISHNLPESFCDVNTAVGPDGKLYVVYIKPGVKGLQVMLSPDRGATLYRGGALDGPYDREWIVVDPVTGHIGYNFSDGYIGGPKSKGIYFAASTDKGQSFRKLSRIDREPEGSYAVDPYLAVGAGGRLYSAWAVSTDYNRIDGYKFAASDDGGKSWKHHAELAMTHHELGDTQERWMLGALVAIGKDSVMAIYQDYGSIDVDGRTEQPLLAYFRISADGGKTWSPARTCFQTAEIEAAIRSFRVSASRSSSVSNYVQTLPWASADPHGRVHVALVDNRSGQKNIGDKRVGWWQVRFATWASGGAGFGTSERVSADWAAERPPLDFIGLCADADYAWVIWTQNPDKVSGMDFTGDLYVGRKTLSKP